jgi:small subunit ribosomal protein S9
MPTKTKETTAKKKASVKKEETVKKTAKKAEAIAEKVEKVEKEEVIAKKEPEVKAEEAVAEVLDFSNATVIIDGEEMTTEPTDKNAKYFSGVGRRKSASARVLLFTRGTKEFIVNGKDYKEYFQTFDLQQKAIGSLNKMKSLERFRVMVKVSGGGLTGQAEAIRLAIARALIDFSVDYRKRLKKAGFLTRDSRVKERKKPGLKGARRAPQFSKR